VGLRAREKRARVRGVAHVLDVVSCQRAHEGLLSQDSAAVSNVCPREHAAPCARHLRVTARVKVVICQCSATASVHIASAQRSAWAGTCPDVKHGCCTSSQTNNSVCQDQNTPLQGTPHLLDLNGFLSKPLLQGAADMRRQRPACAPPASAADRSAAQHAPRALCLSRGVIVCNLWVTTNSRPLEANACNEQLCS